MTWWQHSTTNPEDSSYETLSTDEVIASTKGLEPVIFQISGDYDKEKDLEITPQTEVIVTRTGGRRFLKTPAALPNTYQTNYRDTKEATESIVLNIFKNGDLVDSYSTNGSSETASSELIAYFADKGFDITYLGTEGPDKFKIGSDSSNIYIEELVNTEGDWPVFPLNTDNSEEGNDAFTLVSGQGTFRGGEDRDYFEVGNIEGEFLVNGNQGEDVITGIGNIVYRGGQDNDFIAVSQGEVYGDKGADTFVGVKGDGYAVIQDYTIGEDMIEIDLDGIWNKIDGGSMFTDTSGDQILFLVGIDDVQQVETIDGSSIGGGDGDVRYFGDGDVRYW